VNAQSIIDSGDTAGYSIEQLKKLATTAFHGDSRAAELFAMRVYAARQEAKFMRG